MKTGAESYIFGSEIGSGFEELGGTPPQRIPRSDPGADFQTPKYNKKEKLPSFYVRYIKNTTSLLNFIFYKQKFVL